MVVPWLYDYVRLWCHCAVAWTRVAFHTRFYTTHTRRDGVVTMTFAICDETFDVDVSVRKITEFNDVGAFLEIDVRPRNWRYRVDQIFGDRDKKEGLRFIATTVAAESK